MLKKYPSEKKVYSGNIGTSHEIVGEKGLYKFKNFSLTIKLPDSTTITADNYQPGEISLSVYMQDDKLKYWGYIQLWDLPDLEKFLDKSKETSLFEFTSYKKSNIQFKSLKGHRIDWTAIMLKQRSICSREYFLKKNGSTQAKRISFFTEGNELSESLESAIDSILLSLKWN